MVDGFSLAQGIAAASRQAGRDDPEVRRADVQSGIVTAVGVAAGTVDVGNVRARRLESYQAPAVGDQILLVQSGTGNWWAAGRISGGNDTPWTTATLATGYAHDGNSNGTVQYRVVVINGTRMMQWRGGIGITYSGTTTPNGGLILAAALGASLRPASRRTAPAACSAASSSSLALKADFQTDGTVQIVGTTTASTDTYTTPIIRPPWVSLNSIQYSLD
ncbi:hypothetical protein [Streptomyces sp. NPDC003720]|uniref:hypothetical protein n=1 Tax=Streptomyces sp. NPDC003720 TaxID=3364684 RepID=UPI0036911C2B